ncbi:unnamed protein product [Boreogadus saida]
MSRKTLAWANKEVETFVRILGEEDVVYDVYVAAAAIDIRPTTKGSPKDGWKEDRMEPQVAAPAGLGALGLERDPQWAPTQKGLRN